MVDQPTNQETAESDAPRSAPITLRSAVLLFAICMSVFAMIPANLCMDSLRTSAPQPTSSSSTTFLFEMLWLCAVSAFVAIAGSIVQNHGRFSLRFFLAAALLFAAFVSAFKAITYFDPFIWH